MPKTPFEIAALISVISLLGFINPRAAFLGILAGTLLYQLLG